MAADERRLTPITKPKRSSAFIGVHRRHKLFFLREEDRHA
jgi:hypothetical protein